MNIAIILSGCGNRDGSELQETLSLMLAIDRRNWHYQCFSPEGVFDVVDHFTGNEDGSQRDLFAESARIARGNIKPLSDYNPAQFDALALPGGMGAARSKPIMAMCIAPMVLAKVLGPFGVTLTLGDTNTASRTAELLGAKTQCCTPTQVCIDRTHHVYTTPAYMVASRISEIFSGAENMVAALANDYQA